MKVDMPRLLTQCRVEFISSGPQCSRGWINLACPFCYDERHHLGFNLADQYFHCWKCGPHPLEQTLHELTGLPYDQIDTLMEEFSTRTAVLSQIAKRNRIRVDSCAFPAGTTELKTIHKRYLIKRGYPLEVQDELIQTYHLKGTGMLAPRGWQYRILIPVFSQDGVMQNYTGRDITGQAEIRYKTCPNDKAKTDLKDMVFGLNLLKPDQKSVLVVEGPLDAMKLGPGALACFGTSFTTKQVGLLKDFSKVSILFDSPDKDPNAGRQADKLAAILSTLGVQVELLTLDEGDPGDLDYDEARDFCREVIS